MQTVDGKEFLRILETTDKPVVVDMYADWCMPCRAAAPYYEALARKYSDKAEFLKINVDQEAYITQSLGVTGVPSFFILRGKKILSKIVGANMEKLESNLKRALGIKEASKATFTAYL